jgi:hypothetical protein
MANGSKMMPANIGLSPGITVAVAIYKSVDHAIPGAMLHGFSNWTYVIDYALGFEHEPDVLYLMW